MTENLKSERKNHIENPVTIKKDKRSAAEDLFRIIPKGLDLDPDKIREERLGISTYEEKKLLYYKGYSASPEYSADDHMFYGKILGINDLVDFQSENEEALEDEFHKAVDNYLEFCQEMGKVPQSTFYSNQE